MHTIRKELVKCSQEHPKYMATFSLRHIGVKSKMVFVKQLSGNNEFTDLLARSGGRGAQY